MVGAGDSLGRQEFAGERPEASLHPVADDRSADLFCNGEADANRWVAILAIADEQDETGSGGALPGVGRQEIGALAQRD